jgi:hypothetical protein
MVHLRAAALRYSSHFAVNPALLKGNFRPRNIFAAGTVVTPPIPIMASAAVRLVVSFKRPETSSATPAASTALVVTMNINSGVVIALFFIRILHLESCKMDALEGVLSRGGGPKAELMRNLEINGPDDACL